METNDLIFPKNFFWGAATSSHQIEGNNHNDWTEWEKNHAKKLAKEPKGDLGKWQKWQEEKFPEMFNSNNYISGRACDHYHRFEEDFDIAKSLGHNAARFSIEWSRIEPEEGKFNEKEIEHYRRVILALRECGLEPFVTLWHWPIPLWLREQGGWQSKKAPDYFSRYAEKVVSTLKDHVKFWITLNEPDFWASYSYLLGEWPPQKKNLILYLLVIGNLINAHRKAYRIIKSIQPKAMVGIAKNNIYFEAHQSKMINLILKKFSGWWRNFYFLNQIDKYQDFIGLNHYFRSRINYGFNKNENKIVSDMGWELYPEAIYFVLKDLKKYQKPIYITENGLADAKDEKRAWFIFETLKNIHRAISEGVDVRGYLHWSLMDNFEWDKGFWPRFGLVEVDYKTLERKVRPSAYFYRDICRENGITENIIKKYQELLKEPV